MCIFTLKRIFFSCYFKLMELSCPQTPTNLHFTPLLMFCAVLCTSAQNYQYQTSQTKSFELNWLKRLRPPSMSTAVACSRRRNWEGKGEESNALGRTTHSSQHPSPEPSSRPGSPSAEVRTHLPKGNKTHAVQSHIALNPTALL